MGKTRRFAMACAGVALCTTQIGMLCNLPHNSPQTLTFSSITLSGPSGNQNDLIPVGTALSDWHVYTVTFSGNNTAATTATPLVQLVDEPGGVNISGGLLGWVTPNFAPGPNTVTVRFHLMCPGNSVVGADSANLTCSPLPGCLCTSVRACASTGVCNCFKPDNVTLNDPNSNLGGKDVAGNVQFAHVHAEVAAGAGVSGIKSNTMAIQCGAP